ncbi:MAG: hypothetical protein HW411_1400 [Gammaproteobacteria bacterium]|nr:hypothetical protein [Gammaproteobacteria bacterium]
MAKEFIENIEKLLNRILQQDEAMLSAIGELTGKVIAIEIIGLNHVIYLQFYAAGITIRKECAGKVDVTIKGRPVTLLVMLFTREENTTPRDMEIIGDAGLAQRFQSIMKNMEIDWEEYLSHWMGDTLAHKLGNLFRDVREYVKETKNTIGMDISEYLRYEKEILTDQSEVDEFVAAVDFIRNDVERLRQRITRLEGKMV